MQDPWLTGNQKNEEMFLNNESKQGTGRHLDVFLTELILSDFLKQSQLVGKTCQ